MNLAVKFALEKATQLIQIRVTPAQAQTYRRAAQGNVSHFMRQAANESAARVMTKLPLTPPVVKRYG